MGEESTSLVIEAGSQTSVEGLNELIQDILYGKWAESIEGILKTPSTKDILDKAEEYLTGVKCAENVYNRLGSQNERESHDYEVPLAELREIKFKLSMYIFNGLFKYLYLNAEKINNLPIQPLGSDDVYFASECLKKIGNLRKLRENLLSRGMQNPKEIATKEEMDFLYKIRDRLIFYLNPH